MQRRRSGRCWLAVWLGACFVKAAGGGGSRTALVILGVGGAAGAVAALTLGKGSDSVSPSAP